MRGKKDVNTRMREDAQLAYAQKEAQKTQKGTLQTYENMDEVEAAKKIKAVLLSIAFNDGEFASARIAAIDKWLDRVVGKPIQMNVVRVSQGDEANKAIAEIKRRKLELGYVVDHES